MDGWMDRIDETNDARNIYTYIYIPIYIYINIIYGHFQPRYHGSM